MSRLKVFFLYMKFVNYCINRRKKYAKYFVVGNDENR